MRGWGEREREAQGDSVMGIGWDGMGWDGSCIPPLGDSFVKLVHDA